MGWYATAVWEKLIAAGEPHGITPYGTETMHVLRAEKGYPIIGQDTDGTVTPQDLGMSWAVSKKKADFIGKRSFTRSENLNPLRKQFVGLLPIDAETVLPEGAQIIEAVADGVLPPPPVPDARARHVELPQRRTGPSVRAGAGQGRARPHRRNRSTSPSTEPWSRWRSPAPSSSIPKEHAAMADTLTRRSPLQGFAIPLRGTARFGEHRRGTLRRDGRPVGRPGRTRRCRGCRRALGVDALPTRAVDRHRRPRTPR